MEAMVRRFAVTAVVVGVVAGAPMAANAYEWTLQDVPGDWITLAGVSCPSTDTCMAVGYGIAERWDDVGWATVQWPNDGDHSAQFLTGVSCASPGACLAVGHDLGETDENMLSDSWDGTAWRFVNPPDTGDAYSELRSVSCTGPTWCTSVGDFARRADIPLTLAEHWDGASWTVQSTPNPSRTKPRSSRTQFL